MSKKATYDGVDYTDVAKDLKSLLTQLANIFTEGSRTRDRVLKALNDLSDYHKAVLGPLAREEPIHIDGEGVALVRDGARASVWLIAELVVVIMEEAREQKDLQNLLERIGDRVQA